MYAWHEVMHAWHEVMRAWHEFCSLHECFVVQMQMCANVQGISTTLLLNCNEHVVFVEVTVVSLP